MAITCVNLGGLPKKPVQKHNNPARNAPKEESKGESPLKTNNPARNKPKKPISPQEKILTDKIKRDTERLQRLQKKSSLLRRVAQIINTIAK